jgi:Ca-activated chloride channel family protein
MRSFLNRAPKWLVFGVVGMTGGLLFSLLGEPAAALTESAPVAAAQPNKSPVDLVFVLDVSGSMQKEINGVRSSIVEFTRQSKASGVPMRFALVTFRDLTYDQGTEVIQVFTSDPMVFSSGMTRLRASGGGDNSGESSLDGLKVAAGLAFDPASRRVVVLITDETWHEPDGQIVSASGLASELRAGGIESVHVVASSGIIDTFDFLKEQVPGKRFVLDASGRTESSLARIFEGVAREVVSPSMLGSVAEDAQKDHSFTSYLKGVMSVGLWLSMVSIGVGLSLVAGQKYMLTGSLRVPGLLKSMLLGTLIGAASGVLGQTLFFGLDALGTPDALGKIISWVVVGAGLGFAMTFVIPNISKLNALLCASAGGFVGCVAFMLIVGGMRFSDFGGRVVGALLIGFSVGIAVAMAEVIAREAYLIVHWAKNEKSTVNIGGAPVLVGTSVESTVRISPRTGYPGAVATFKVVGGKPTLINHMSHTTHVLKDGNKLTLGTVVIEVRIVH